ncbi:hypothetical protein Misp01_00360 [Microtetraspora sp. NBRC 13810]|uniref:ABC transporter ATP-binding protein n=1 Tax=Microtetraspora sp. NBRC 13810 TaxID=3030990 RepID=UPI0024A365D8|nr:ATP-binding cassette domain-containing protein [Microtetraspora sp. NBRC 13810]GLW04906.1 hypothetical protein Misp01_00360 [Microtetraspora sp. NBRC 13810]
MRLSNVSFRYMRRGPWVLREVELDLRPGEVVEIVGRNGAGKSTLLKLLAGALRPTRGSVVDRPPVVGYAPDAFPTGQPFTVAAYLAAVARIRGVAGPGPWPERLGMTELLDLPLGDLSKGSAHKVGLAQALLASPGLLILDEPFAGLDAQTRAELPVIAGEIAAAGGIVVVSDHQGGLRDLASRRRLSVVDHRLADAPPEAEEARPRLSVVEILVDSAEAPELTAELRARGYDAHLRPAPPPDAPAEADSPTPPDAPTAADATAPATTEVHR